MPASIERSVCVFCGSSPGKRAEYAQVAEDVGRELAASFDRLVYGGGSRGCMGTVASACLEANGSVLGVIPEAMASNVAPRGHPTTSAEGKGPVSLRPPGDSSKGRFEVKVTQDMHERKKYMAAQSGAGFVALPGGYGTFEEVFEMVTWTQLGIHRKPIVLANACGFYEPLRDLVQKAIEDGFIAPVGANLIHFVDEADAKRLGGWGKAVVVKVNEANDALAASEEKGYFDWSSKQTTTSATASACIKQEELSIDVQNLTFAFSQNAEPALQECNLSLSKGSRCLLIGANGAGKSTILRLLAGKRMPAKGAHMRVFGRDVFYDSRAGITYLGTEWAMNPVVRSDIKVSTFLDSVGGYRHKERRDQLLDILDVDTNWRMHAISDGERRRVQLTMGLMEPWDVLLLDEVTVDLDVQVRADLLAFLQSETETRGATIIYATHIFDGLQDFPTHLVHMRLGKTTTQKPIAWPPASAEPALPGVWQDALRAALTKTQPAPTLFETALAWLREDREARTQEEQAAAAAHDAEGGGGGGGGDERLRKKRGAIRSDNETDSEKFFSKYDYSQAERR